MNTSKTKQLFLIDGLGALISAFLLGVILTRFEAVFGIPLQTLYVLSIFPCIFAVYDFGCYVLVSKKDKMFLKAIAFANLLYCFISIALLFQHYDRLTYVGWIYFLLEIVIIIILARIELKIASLRS